MPFLTIQKELDISESPEYQKLLEDNKTLLVETERHIIERQELQELRNKLEVAEAEKVDRAELLALQQEIEAARAAMEAFINEKHIAEEEAAFVQVFDAQGVVKRVYDAAQTARNEEAQKLHEIARKSIVAGEEKTVQAKKRGR